LWRICLSTGHKGNTFLAKETEALRIDGDTLVVRVHQAAWRQQLTYFREELLAKLKAELGDDSVEDIRFV
jgi:predicted nucleic acid-binding Zn ribbon protein